MLNTHDLEKRWLQYKIKSYIPYFVLALTLIFILTAVIFFMNDSQEDNNEVKNNSIQKTEQTSLEKQKEKTKQVKNTIQTAIANKPIYQTKEDKKEPAPQISSTQNNLILKPSMDFMKNLHTSTPDSYHPTSVPTKKKTEKKVVKKRKEVSKQKAPKEEYIEIETQKPIQEVKEKAPQEQKVQITIKRRESENDIKEVIKRFQKNNNPALSLFAAKKYYELGNYKQAYNYALVTNKINNDIEESWLIFAKSLVKLGKKDQALKTLHEYIKYSHSSNAQVLFDEIQRGKFQ
ncbi:MAG: CDC27 family protein [Sulfurimonas sp.]